MNEVLEQNAQYGTGAGSGDGVHPNAGKTGTTENHGNAWFCGYTRDLSTTVWMGYLRGQTGIYEMQNVHGVPVAGATFPVPIWHEFMRSAEWRKLGRSFDTPRAYPVYRSWERGDWGSTWSSDSSTSTYSTGDTTR